MTSTPSSTPAEAGGPAAHGTAHPADSGPPLHGHESGVSERHVDPLPVAPETPAVDADLGRVELFDTGGLDWQPVSSRLVTARTVTLLAWLVPMTVALAVGGALLTSWLWVAAGVLALVIVWGLWLIRRQVSAMSYIELSEDLVVRKGRLFRQVSSVPFGRLQYVDLQSGPLERKLGMATLQIFTASPSTSATIPGLPIETAEQMRERLMLRGEAQRAGL
ncbi:MAG: PH domain-containing protein [Dermatophilaceae bacterium]